MEQWKFFDITHREHVYCNPMSVAKFEELIALLRLEPENRALDIASGKGEFLIRLAEQYGIEGIGVDLSPYFVSNARKHYQKRIPDAQLSFLEMDGADYKPTAPENFSLVACIGASWIFDGYKETLIALSEMAAPDGWVVVGEPYWLKEPATKYLEAIDQKRNSFGTHDENMKVGQDLGLKPVYTLVSNKDDWDRYEGLQWYAAEDWARKNPEDPDVEEILKRVHKDRENYLRMGRETLGWAVYLFKKEIVKK